MKSQFLFAPYFHDLFILLNHAYLQDFANTRTVKFEVWLHIFFHFLHIIGLQGMKNFL